MSKTGIGSHTKPNRGESVNWITPPEVVDALGLFDLDPCCPRFMPWRTANVMLSRDRRGNENPEAATTLTACGLQHKWSGRVWLNPPYDKSLPQWFSKLARHGNGCALVFARTETEWFFKWVWPWATALRFIAGRLTFRLPDGAAPAHNSGGPSVLVAYGPACAEQLRTCAIPGAFVDLNAARYASHFPITQPRGRSLTNADSQAG